MMNEKQKILIVDDRKENLVALRQVLRGVDANIVETTSGNEALVATLEHDFALAIIDVQMPGMDGYELAENLRGDEKTRVLPIVFLTASMADEQRMFKGYQVGGVDYMVKPYAPEILVGKVSVFLEMERDKRELQKHRDHLETLVEERTAALHRSNRALAALSACRQALVRATSENTLLDEVCRIVVEIGGYRLAWVGFAEHNAAKLVRPVAQMGTKAGYLDKLGISWADTERGRGPTGTAIRTGRPVAVRQIPTAAEYAPWREAAIVHGYASSIALPLMADSHTFGALTVCSSRPDAFDDEDEGLLRELANDLAYGVTAQRVRAAHDRAEQERRGLEARLRQAQKMEAIGQLAGGVAHDFNNLLTVILGNSEHLLSAINEQGAPQADELREGLGQIRLAGEQAASLTRQLLAFSRREITQPEVLDPKQIVRSMKGLLQRLLGEHVQLNLELGAGNASVHADPGQIELVVMNLAVNAADAMPEGGQLTIRAEDAEVLESHVAEHADATPGRHVLLSVVDNGTGMTPDTEAHMFEPFFTTKPVGKGTGLGLATVYGTVQRLGGHIRVESEFGVGSTFSIYIPAVDAKEAAREPDLEPVHAATGETILVCEDQAPVRKLICLTLRAASYQVIEAGDGNQALAATAAHAGKIDMLISDVVMPGMSGAMLADRLTLEYPDMRVLLISGYSADHLSGDNIRDGTAEFLPKPFGPTALLRRTREVLEQPAG